MCQSKMVCLSFLHTLVCDMLSQCIQDTITICNNARLLQTANVRSLFTKIEDAPFSL